MLLAAAERGWIPDPLLRAGIRRRLALGLRRGEAERDPGQAALLARLRRSPIAAATPEANRQHYEVPADFFATFLGPRTKYSACLWPAGVSDLAAAEEAMLALTCRRAGIEDGMRVLDLGCGWGSLALWIAERHPACRVVAVSSSGSQRRWIEDRAGERGLAGVEAVTADAARFAPEGRFDRVVSVEMFEHLRNWEAMLERIAGWIAPGGRLFVHHFCHSHRVGIYEASRPGDWMARHFFTGGLMPSADLLDRLDAPWTVEARWDVGGRHYARTLNAWLAQLDARRERALEILASADPQAAPRLAFHRWRLFLLACAETFAYRGGREWLVAHRLLAARGTSRSRPRADTR